MSMKLKEIVGLDPAKLDECISEVCTLAYKHEDDSISALKEIRDTMDEKERRAYARGILIGMYVRDGTEGGSDGET